MDLQASLRDIAQLLLLLNKNYFKNVSYDSDILFSLLEFLQSLNLLGNIISVIDAEKFRRDIMNDKNIDFDKNRDKNEIVMDYDQFYGWLRKVADKVYYLNMDDSSIHKVMKSMNSNPLEKLLIERILPFAVGGFNESSHLSTMIVMEQTSFDIMIAYEYFFKLIFFVISNGNIIEVCEFININNNNSYPICL